MSGPRRAPAGSGHAPVFAFLERCRRPGRLTADALGALERFESVLGDPAPQPPFAEAKAREPSLPDGVLLLLLEAKDLVNNRWRDVLDRASSLPSGLVDSLDEDLAVEHEFNLLLCRSRLGEEDLELGYLGRLEARVRTGGFRDVAKAARIEACAGLMGRGLYREALRRLSRSEDRPPQRARETRPAARDSAPDPLFWNLRREIVAGICHQACGEFAASEARLDRQEDLLASFPSLSLGLALRRRRLGALVEAERYARAEEVFESDAPIVHGARQPVASALFLQEGVRLFVAVGNMARAREAFEEQARILAERGIGRTFLAAMEERCEFALAAGDPEEAATIIARESWWGAKRGEFNLQCVAQFFLARALLATGAHEAAFRATGAALELAEKYDYGRDRVRILCLRGSIALSAGDGRVALACFLVAREASSRMGLDCHVSLAATVLAGSFPRSFEPAWWSGTFRSHATLARARHFAGVYGLSARAGAWEFVGILLAGRRAYVAAGRSFHAWSEGKGMAHLGLRTRLARDSLLAFLARRPSRGATLAELHRTLYPRVAWRSERHSARLHSLLRDMRASLAPLGLRIGREEERYVIEGDEPLVLVAATASGAARAGPGTRGKGSVHDAPLLALLRGTGPRSGAALARELGITRQTLHPILARLRARGRVRFEKKGRFSLYSIAPDAPSAPDTQGAPYPDGPIVDPEGAAGALSHFLVSS